MDYFQSGRPAELYSITKKKLGSEMGIANHPDVSQLGIRSKRMITDITNLPVLKVLLRHKKVRRVLSEDYSLGQGLLTMPYWVGA